MLASAKVAVYSKAEKAEKKSCRANVLRRSKSRCELSPSREIENVISYLERQNGLTRRLNAA